MNKYRLLEAASMAGIKTIAAISEATKIPKSVLSAKLNGHRPFDTKEIMKICDSLNITDNAVKVEIFLSETSQ